MLHPAELAGIVDCACERPPAVRGCPPERILGEKLPIESPCKAEHDKNAVPLVSGSGSCCTSSNDEAQYPDGCGTSFSAAAISRYSAGIAGAACGGVGEGLPTSCFGTPQTGGLCGAGRSAAVAEKSLISQLDRDLLTFRGVHPRRQAVLTCETRSYARACAPAIC